MAKFKIVHNTNNETEVYIEGIPINEFNKKEFIFYVNNTEFFRRILNKAKQEATVKLIQEIKEKIEKFNISSTNEKDCLGLKEHKVLTLNTIYKYDIEQPKTREMKKLKDFAESCFEEGWIHALSLRNDYLKHWLSEKEKELKE
ncbi:MAG: hypothetical protein AABY22_09825 [Nanoarchaeota archaeon]